MPLFWCLVQGFAIGCLLLAASPFGASAQTGQPTPDRFLRKFDKDHDGKVSREEFEGPQKRFANFDIDGDGFATKGELETFFGGRAEEVQSRSAVAANAPLAAWYANLPVILTHTHIWPRAKDRNAQDDWNGATRNALEIMDENGIRAAIIMPTPSPRRNSDNSIFENLLRLAMRHPGRFKVAGGGGSLNGMIEGIEPDDVDDEVRRKFIGRAEEIIRKGGVGFGETTALHFSGFEGHPFEETPPDHPLYLLLADLAAQHGVPLDVHIEAVTRRWAVSDELRNRGRINPEWVDENIAEFERLLSHNPKARIIWVHLGMDSTGQRSPALMRRLLKAHQNLYVSVTARQQYTRSYRLFVPGAGLDSKWRELILEFPDRFMIGSDAFFQPNRPTRDIGGNLTLAVRLVRNPKFLPPDVARKVAFENAQRVYGLSFVDANDYPLPAGVAGQPAERRSGDAAFLSETEIRQVFIGNTASFQSPRNSQAVLVYFAENGAVLVKAPDGSDRLVSKKWFFKDGGFFCRTVGADNRSHCVRVVAGENAGIFEFVLQQRRYQVTVLAGRQLPQ